MKKIIIFGTIMLIMGSFLFHHIMRPAEAFGQSSKKVLMILPEGYCPDIDFMIKMEVGVMTILLKRAGMEVDIATTSGQRIFGPTQKIEKVLRLADVKSDDYVGVIMPSMGVGAFPGPPVSSEAVAMVKRVLTEGKPVAAGVCSVTILAEGGILKGKKYAFIRDPLKTDANFKLTDLRFDGAIYSGDGVVQDGKIITAGACPLCERGLGLQNRTVELTQTFIAAIGSK